MRAPLKHSFMHGRLSQVWLQPAIIFFVVAIGVMASFVLDWRRADSNMHLMARERGAALFRLVQLTREWNARHDGVYVPVTPSTRPNPWLDHERRDLVTEDGIELTMINAAFMTRQLADMARQAEGIQIHLTSLNPLRPANRPDAWEAEALRRFDAGLAELVELVPGEVPVHRYMAPVKVTKPCVKCHERRVMKSIRCAAAYRSPCRRRSSWSCAMPRASARARCTC